MKTRSMRPTLQPALLELILTILFFSLAMTVVVRLLAAADDISRTSALESRALIIMQSTAESIKADPEAGGGFDETGSKRYTLDEDGLCLSVCIRRKPGSAGTLYSISITASSGGKNAGSLTAARYISGEVGA